MEKSIAEGPPPHDQEPTSRRPELEDFQQRVSKILVMEMSLSVPVREYHKFLGTDAGVGGFFYQFGNPTPKTACRAPQSWSPLRNVIPMQTSGRRVCIGLRGIAPRMANQMENKRDNLLCVRIPTVLHWGHQAIVWRFHALDPFGGLGSQRQGLTGTSSKGPEADNTLTMRLKPFWKYCCFSKFRASPHPEKSDHGGTPDVSMSGGGGSLREWPLP